jgi:predicted XRE-type DNA-binding protein
MADATEVKTKLCLAQAINRALHDQGLKQKEAARLLRIRQPKISALANYRLTGFSLERLLNFLNALGWDIEILVNRANGSSTPGIHVAVTVPKSGSGTKGAKQ